MVLRERSLTVTLRRRLLHAIASLTPRIARARRDVTFPSDKSECADCVAVLRISLDAGNARDQLVSLRILRRLLSREGNPPIDAAVETGLVPIIMRYLRQQLNPKLQFEALWALTNIMACGTSAHVAVVLAAGALPLFVELLDSPDMDVREQAVWAIGNVAGDSPANRDAVLATPALAKMLPLLGQHSNPTFVRNVAWTISNCLRGRPNPPLHVAAQVLPTLALLLYMQDKETLVDSSWALAYFTDSEEGEGAALQLVVEIGICARLAELLQHESVDVQAPALRVIGNIISGNEMQTRAMIDAGALKGLQMLLDGRRAMLKKEACWVVSNIMAGTTLQIQAAIDANLPQALVQVMATAGGAGARETRREACWAIANATGCGTTEQIYALLRAAVVPQLARIAASGDEEPKITLIALEGLENILHAAPALAAAGLMPGAELLGLFEQADVPSILYEIDVHRRVQPEEQDFADVALKARSILQTFFPGFSAEDDEEEDAPVRAPEPEL